MSPGAPAEPVFLFNCGNLFIYLNAVKEHNVRDLPTGTLMTCSSPQAAPGWNANEGGPRQYAETAKQDAKEKTIFKHEGRAERPFSFLFFPHLRFLLLLSPCGVMNACFLI